MLRIPILLTLVGLAASAGASAGRAPIEVAVYRSGECASWREAVATVKAAARELGVKANVRVVKVADVDEARRLNFHGSPSVVIAGVDVEGPEVASRPSSFG